MEETKDVLKMSEEELIKSDCLKEIFHFYCNFDERLKKPLEGKEPSLNG